MLKRTERISFRISSVLSKVEPGAGAGPSHRLRPKSTGSGSTTLDVVSVGDADSNFLKADPDAAPKTLLLGSGSYINSEV